MDLAHVVQQGGSSDLFHLARAQTELPSKCAGQIRHALRVTRCVWITRFDRLHHQLEQVSVNLLQLQVYLVNVSNEKQRQYKNQNARDLKPHVEVREKGPDRRREHIIYDGSASNSDPSSFERLAQS